MEFFIAFHTTHITIITPQNIRGGFKKTDLIPFNPDYIISKLNIKLKTQTPPKTTLPRPQP